MINNMMSLPKLNDKGSRFDLVISVLDTPLFILFEEIFKKARYYELGLDFFYICQDELQKNKEQIEDWVYDIYQADLISLKLEMLDYLNRWDEYISYTHEILDTLFIENRLNFYIDSVNKRYIIKDKKGRRRIHFLCKFENRYDIITRKIRRRNAGKSTAHLERHQQDRLSYEEIERRYKMVVDFFNLCYKTDL